jgi:hypothetical protein
MTFDEMPFDETAFDEMVQHLRRTRRKCDET